MQSFLLVLSKFKNFIILNSYSCIEQWFRLNFSCPNCLFKVEHVFKCFENKMEEVLGFNLENKKIEKKGMTIKIMFTI